MNKIQLSIIIPYFNTKEYTDELLSVLEKQINNDVEILVVDDGSDVPYFTEYNFAAVKRISHGGQGRARNIGIECTFGEYIQFVDSDDMVSENFIEKLFEKIPEGRDIIEYSWRSLNTNGAMFNYRVSKDGDRLKNPSACTRCFKRSYIGNIRFNEQKDACEDEDFSRRLGYLREPVDPISVSIIPDYLYFYRTDVEGSNVKRYKNGLCKTKRILYFYNHVTEDRRDIVEQIQKDDEQNEVILFTYQNDIPELERWCQVMRPCSIWTHYQKGEEYRGCSIVPIPEQYEIVLFIGYLHVIGGIESFIFHFADLYEKVTLIVNSIHIEQRERIGKKIQIVDYNPDSIYFCDTLILLRILDSMPGNIRAKQTVRMCHGCRTNPNWHIPQDSDFIVNVSEASKESFDREAKNALVIHNPITRTNEKALILVSATRIPASDKGNNEHRMRLLAERLNEAQIPFIWFNFSDGRIDNAPRGMINVGIEMDIQPYIARADYLVQLSDSEAWSYSILEALVNGIPVLVCPFPSAAEMGIEDGVNGYIIPFDMGFNVNRLLKVPSFKYLYDNKGIKKTWDKIINHKIKPKKPKGVKVRILMTYNDTLLKRQIQGGEVITVSAARAKAIVNAGIGEVKI